jgi:Leucine-rich repeat (LRR) protein
MGILERCDGLPLAIKVIGGLLSTKYPSESEWKAVLNNPAWSVDGLPQELDNRLYLSYEDLSPHQKQCFLYCGLFPKGTCIPRDVVISMWISEGFIQPPETHGSSHDDDRLENVAMEYYWGLIKRNLIQPEEDCIIGYWCTLHDVVRSFAEYMAREEMLVVRNGQDADSGSGLVRRLSIAPRAVPVPDWAILKKQKSLRTLALYSKIKLMPGDSLKCFSSLRVLSIDGTCSDRLVDSLCNLNHLRYLYLNMTNISRLPDSIDKMKFLQFIMLLNCKKLDSLPNVIVKLVQLRYLDISGSNVSTVPKGFCGLTNLRSLYGFPVHVDDTNHVGSHTSSWCSLQELAPLSQLRQLTLHGLEKVPASRMAEKALISSKGHLRYLHLNYSSARGGEFEQQLRQSVIEEEVLEKLCPPTYLENLVVEGGYAGQQLPNWMCAPTSAADFKSLRIFTLKNLPCCTQLPKGLCCFPCLELLIIEDAPAIKRIGQKFQVSSSLPARDTAIVALAQPPFPKLRVLTLIGLCEWEEWEWNEDDGCEAEQQGNAKDAIAMPCLEILTIDNCKLGCLPPGLASVKRQALRELNLYNLTNLTYVENFSSVVELDVFRCPKLKRISGLSRLHKIRIAHCLKLKVLEGVPSLDSLVLEDATMEALPEYLQAVNPRYIKVGCSKNMCELLLSPGSSEWNKIRHIGKHNIVDLDSWRINLQAR